MPTIEQKSPSISVASFPAIAPTSATLSAVPFWVHIGNALSYTAFSTAGTSLSIALYTLPAAGVLHALKIKHSAAFTGPSIVSYSISLGVSGNTQKYMPAFDVLQTPSGTAVGTGQLLIEENNSSTTGIYATANCSGANLSAATTGSVDIWALLSNAS